MQGALTDDADVQMGKSRLRQRRKQPGAGQDSERGRLAHGSHELREEPGLAGCCQAAEPRAAAEETSSRRLSEVLGKCLWSWAGSVRGQGMLAL